MHNCATHISFEVLPDSTIPIFTMQLKTQYKTYLYILISAIFLAIIAICIYYLLGGFKEIIIAKTIKNSYSIAGKEFIGSYKNDTLGLYFNQMKTIIDQGKLNGDLCLINYQDSTLKNNDVHQFIGILLVDDISEIPTGLHVREMNAETSFIAALIMHPLVRPNSEKVQAMLVEFAKKEGYKLDAYTLERFYADNSVIVEMIAIEE